MSVRLAAFVALVTAALMAVGAVWLSSWPATLLALVLFFGLAAHARTGWQAFWYGWWVWLPFAFLTFYWLNYTMIVYGGLPWIGSILIFLLYCLCFGLKLPLLSSLLWTLKSRAPDRVFWTWPLAVVAMELAPLSLFPWCWAACQTGNLPFLQAADLVGVRGLAWPMAVIALWFYRMWLPPRPTRSQTAFVALLVLCWYGYGFVRARQVEAAAAAAPHIRVAVVQPDTPLIWDENGGAQFMQVMETCKRLTQEAARQGPVDLVVWPEGGAPVSFDSRRNPADVYFNRLITELARMNHTEILFNETEVQGDQSYNAATLIDRLGHKVGSYEKMHLLAFGEYMPLGNVFPALRRFGIYDLTPGQDVRVLPLDRGGRVAPEICYEILFPDFTRRFMQRGANLIVNLTDDAWFGPTPASLEHLDLLLPRAIENRVALIRCTNSGISTVLGPTGVDLTPRSAQFVSNVQVADVPLLHMPTFYTRFGDVFCWGCIGMLVFLVLMEQEFKKGEKSG
ncbi:MAG TPA: apolipoprotein N-acyltransferase, partial [Candidatus Xenobia bacterium]